MKPIFYAIDQNKVQTFSPVYIPDVPIGGQWGPIQGVFRIYGHNLGGLMTFAEAFQGGTKFRAKMGYVSIAGYGHPILAVKQDHILVGILSQSNAWKKGLSFTEQSPLYAYYWDGKFKGWKDPQVYRLNLYPYQVGCGTRCRIYQVPRQALYPGSRVR